jgi:hypothetical protein
MFIGGYKYCAMSNAPKNRIWRTECEPNRFDVPQPPKYIEVGLVTEGLFGTLDVPLYYFGFIIEGREFDALAIVNRPALEIMWRQIFVYLETHPEDE